MLLAKTTVGSRVKGDEGREHPDHVAPRSPKLGEEAEHGRGEQLRERHAVDAVVRLGEMLYLRVPTGQEALQAQTHQQHHKAVEPGRGGG